MLNIVIHPSVSTDGGDFRTQYLERRTVSAFGIDLPNPILSMAAERVADQTHVYA